MSPHPKPAWWGFWETFPKKWWTAVDWECWEKAGRPRVPREMELPSLTPAKELGNTPVIPPPGPQPSFGLFAKPRRREARNAQSRAVDGLIEKALGLR